MSAWGMAFALGAMAGSLVTLLVLWLLIYLVGDAERREMAREAERMEGPR